ncbi:hypothetical protein M9M90_07245 [Phenylobacterium sp. LH3H17]|uniref:hypothetical protein n=1 Tax=Phenylobacterium sp. LH3H17 TaxID=2903901 RepID=UPI0020C959A1|nr:hypothetical protein [Phenylobacterium sp. LH3H17]UTP40970.1 hypothetical protein M9M90_07245 [Phenylobacterium sp. LH3H17]
MNVRWTIMALGLALASCSKADLQNLATATRDRAESIGAESRRLASLEGADGNNEYLISRKPSLDAPPAKDAPPPERPGDSLASDPTSPFAPQVEPSPESAPKSAFGLLSEPAPPKR